MKREFRIVSGPGLLIAATFVLAACAAPEKNAMLEEARQAYASARSDPEVMNRAPIELNEAGEALSRAEELHERDVDIEDVTHQAYLARQKTAIARETAQLSLAQQQIDQADAMRQKVLLEARQRELESTRQLAQTRQQELEEARRLAQEREEALSRQQQERQAELQKLQSELQDLQAKQTERGIVLTLSDVLFDLDKAQIKPGAERTLEALTRFLEEYPDRQVAVEGFTDSTGPEDYNQNLSEERAAAVKQELASRGIDPQRIQTRGYGEQFPVATNETTAGRQLNRRVEIVISKPGEDAVTRKRR